MANNNIKVPGYVKKVVYNGNIEYRNFSPDLVGTQLASEGGTPMFTMGNFNITTNLDPKTDKIFITNNFSDFVSLADLDLSISQTQTLLDNNATVFLNLDKSKLSYYAMFGSLSEFIRVSLENIIINWPAALFISPIAYTSNGEQIVGDTFENYSYDLLTDSSTFKIATNIIKNPYSINYLTNGEISGTFNESNGLRNLVTNYDSYVVYFQNIEYKVLGFTGVTNTTDNYLYFKVKGSPLLSATTADSFHIKPNQLLCEKFFNSLDEFEYYLLNRQVFPIYTSRFTYPLRTETGIILYTETSLTWPTSDGYNLDFDTLNYVEYAGKLFELADESDSVSSNLMTRFLVTESITGFDTLPIYLADEHEDTSGGKVNKLLNIYGRSFDDFNKFIQGISFANTVSYDKLDNTPDIYLKNIARVMGWELVDSVISNDLLTDYVSSTSSTYSGQSVGLTPVEADTELWRRIILNTPWIWKSKGARKSVEFLLRFIGTPNGLVTFNEYVYKADKPIDVELFKTLLQLNGLEDDISLYPIDSDGYPRFFDDTDDLYYQGNGLWYRETSGANSIIDITTGNNPHIGPYDNGYKFLNQLSLLIPNFSAVTITSETITTTSTDLFSNYGMGEINNYSGDTFVDVMGLNGMDLKDCVIVQSSIIDDPNPEEVISPCGCPTDENDNSLSICFKEKTFQPTLNCEYAKTDLTAEEGWVIVSNYGITPPNTININVNYETRFIDPDCCVSVFNGVPMYNDYFQETPNYTLSDSISIQSGFVCCIKDKCGCVSSCNWRIQPQPIMLPIGDPFPQPYLDFISLYGYGSSVVTTVDASSCPPLYTIAVPNVYDPNTGLVGVGCRVTNYGLQNYNDLYNLMINKSLYAETERACCSYFNSDNSIPLISYDFKNSVLINQNGFVTYQDFNTQNATYAKCTTLNYEIDFGGQGILTQLVGPLDLPLTFTAMSVGTQLYRPTAVGSPLQTYSTLDGYYTVTAGSVGATTNAGLDIDKQYVIHVLSGVVQSITEFSTLPAC